MSCSFFLSNMLDTLFIVLFLVRFLSYRSRTKMLLLNFDSSFASGRAYVWKDTDIRVPFSWTTRCGVAGIPVMYSIVSPTIRTASLLLSRFSSTLIQSPFKYWHSSPGTDAYLNWKWSFFFFVSSSNSSHIISSAQVRTVSTLKIPHRCELDTQ